MIKPLGEAKSVLTTSSKEAFNKPVFKSMANPINSGGLVSMVCIDTLRALLGSTGLTGLPLVSFIVRLCIDKYVVVDVPKLGLDLISSRSS